MKRIAAPAMVRAATAATIAQGRAGASSRGASSATEAPGAAVTPTGEFCMRGTLRAAAKSSINDRTLCLWSPTGLPRYEGWAQGAQGDFGAGVPGPYEGGSWPRCAQRVGCALVLKARVAPAESSQKLVQGRSWGRPSS